MQKFESIGDHSLFIIHVWCNRSLIVKYFLKTISKSPRAIEVIISNNQRVLIINLTVVCKWHGGAKDSRAVEAISTRSFNAHLKYFIVGNAIIRSGRIKIQQSYWRSASCIFFMRRAPTIKIYQSNLLSAGSTSEINQANLRSIHPLTKIK